VRILLVAHAFPPEATGGTERYAEAVARGLVARGHEVAVFAGSLEWRPKFAVARDRVGPLEVARVRRSDLYFDQWDKGGEPRVAREFERELDRVKPDVVHLHHWIRLSDDLVRRAAAGGVATVAHLHDLFTSCPRVFRVKPGATAADEGSACDLPLGRAACVPCVPRWPFQDDAEIGESIDRYARELGAELAAAARCLAPSRSHAERLRARAAATVAIEVLAHPRLPGGIVAPCARAASSRGKLRVNCFGMVAPLKGVHVLLTAVRSLGADGGGVAVDLHGPFATPEYEARLRALAAGLDVRFHGAYVADEPCRTPSDVVVLPTLAVESWSFALDEAGRMGLPIVASATGAIAERVAAARRASRVRLVPPGDVAALAAALRELRDDPAARATLEAGEAPDGMELDDHVARLVGHYEAARAARRPGAQALPPPEALFEAWQRREETFQHRLRHGKSGAPPGPATERG